MSGILATSVPWGRPVVSAIPVPPFWSPEEHRRFLDLLQLHIALIDDGAPTFSTKVLNDLLDRSLVEGWWEFGDPLDPLILQVCMTTFFPVPWTPLQFAKVLNSTGEYNAPVAHRGDVWHWEFDPSYIATPRQSGGWEVEVRNRGTSTVETLAGDGDLVLLWMEHYRNQFAHPASQAVERADIQALLPAVAAIQEVHVIDTARTYPTGWRSYRNSNTPDTAPHGEPQ
ncbi:hypothetical protein [Nocardia sp. NPDC056000]|uniref:hypothetical protein n=1 Tax=Nocardia sp. NPDC056000 TaxID=3345674 RepID=UPI0035D80015